MKKSKVGIIVGIIAVIILGGLGFYYGYYVRTPEYSLNIIRESVKNHDVSTFEKHVDLDKLLDGAVDDIIEATMSDQKDAGSELAKGFIEMMKPSLVSELKKQVLETVEGTEESSSSSSSSSGGNKKDEAAQDEAVEDQAGLKNADFKEIAYVKKDGKKATVGLKVSHPSLDEDYVLDLAMVQLEDGSWQVTRLTNLKDYVKAVQEKQKAELKQYIQDTKAIVDESNKKFKAALSTQKPEVEQAKDVLASNKERAAKIDEIPVPPGAQALAEKRKKSMELDNKAFQMFIDANGKPDRETAQKIDKLFDERRDVEREITSMKQSVGADD